MLCTKCGFEGNPNLQESGPHTKASCQKCGCYIKMLGKKELEEQIKGGQNKEENGLNFESIKSYIHERMSQHSSSLEPTDDEVRIAWLVTKMEGLIEKAEWYDKYWG